MTNSTPVIKPKMGKDKVLDDRGKAFVDLISMIICYLIHRSEHPGVCSLQTPESGREECQGVLHRRHSFSQRGGGQGEA